MSKNCIIKVTMLVGIMEIPILSQFIKQQNSITLKGLDYNEPQKDKDQCGRGSTLARNALRRYIDEGNITKAEGIFKALLASPINNAKGTRSRI